MLTLRPYQQQAIDNIYTFFKTGGKHCILQAPTGSGKTVIFSQLSKLVASKSNKILILTNRTELLRQAGGSIERAGLNSYYIEAGCKHVNANHNVYIAMAQTLRNRIKDQYWIDFVKTISLVIIDECHIQDFNYIFETGLLEKKHVIGFTATPLRAGKQRQLALDYEKIITTVSVKELIDRGYLVNDDYYGCMAPKMDGVQIDRMNGDYKENQMFQRYNTTQLYSGVVKNYQEHTPNTKAICFCVNIEHCIRTAIAMNESGISAKFIVSGISAPKMLKEDAGSLARYEERKKVYDLYQQYLNIYSGSRDEVFEGFKNGEFKVLINAGIATTGFDSPDCETIILNRATTSLTLLLQMIGRGSRICDTKTHFNILDFGDNCGRLGFYSEDRNWSLWHEETTGNGLPPVKECGHTSEGNVIKGKDEKKGCRRLILAAYDICPFCGFKYPDKPLAGIDLTNIVFDFEKLSAMKTKPVRTMTHAELHTYWKTKGHKPAWLWRQLWFRGGEKELRDFGMKYHWSPVVIEKAKCFCEMIK